MTDRQRELIYSLSEIYREMTEECMNDEKFHDVMIENNNLYPMSLDDMAFHWREVAERENS